MEYILLALTGANLVNNVTGDEGVNNMLSGLPVEMITMLGSSVLGGIMSIWSQSIKAKQDEQKMLLARADNQMKHIEKARTYENKGFQWTRRIIALTAVFMVIAYPKLVPVFFDVTHALQTPGGRADSAGGRRAQITTLARAGMATGLAGLFLEAHPDPEKAKCDGPCALRLSQLEPFLAQLKELDTLVKGFKKLDTH